MVGLKTPKRIPVDALRKAVGDARANDILTVIYGPKLLGPPEIRIARKTYESMLAILEGREPTGAVYQMLPAIMRLYFRTSPQAKGRFMVWCRKQLSGDVTEDNGEVEGGLAQTAAEMAADVKKPRRRAAKKVAKRQRAGARG